MTQVFIRKLPNAALDIVGDVHGELHALETLLEHLGYDVDGKHPDDRHLVFVGDLCDRGNNSPGVLRKVQNLIENKKASAIIGNHELNLLLNDAKDGSGWFFEERQQKDNEYYAPYVKATESEISALPQFLKTLPLALEREDIRIVHACWNAEAINRLRTSSYTDLLQAYRAWEKETTIIAEQSGIEMDYQKTLLEWGEALENAQIQPPFLQTIADYEILERQYNPIKVLTSGLEEQASAPFFIGNKWRFTDRTRWWDSYNEDTPVVIGHYWRLLMLNPNASRFSQLFDDVECYEWHGRKKNVFCVDFSVGARWRERHPEILAPENHFLLAALRWPENRLMLHTGQEFSLSVDSTSQI